MAQTYTFLFAPQDATGHFNASIGIAQPLLRRGHKIVFVTTKNWKGKLEPLGFIEEALEDEAEGYSHEGWAGSVEQIAPILALDPMEHIIFTQHTFRFCVENTKKADSCLRKIMARVSPDVVVVDRLVQAPALVNHGVPWVLATSVNPMKISSKNVPPAYTGYKIQDGDKKLWKKHAEKEAELLKDVFEDYKSWLMENGGPKLEHSYIPFWHKYSPYANLYSCPKELAYTDFRPDPPNWHRVDTFMRIEKHDFEIPAELKNLPGKLIYFSMGTWASYDLQLMKKLISFLGKSSHRFIVSKGPLADRLELHSNMWGAAFVPQTQVMPLVDLVVTHAGINTTTEAFYFGKKCLVLPYFSDQLDNAQIIQETGLGLRLNPHHTTQAELLSAIQKLLDDDLLGRRMISISERMQASNSQDMAASVIENVAKEHSAQGLQLRIKEP